MTQKAHNFTDAQTRAIDIRKKLIVVSAGAGSGKTSVLTARYIKLLEELLAREKGGPNNIITLTYTEKAANEMRERILSNDKFRADRELRSKIFSAPIGTIHSFCSALLRKFAFNLGLDPTLRVVDQAEASDIKAKAARGAVISALKKGDDALQIFDFITDMGQDNVIKALHEAYESGIRKGITPEDMEISNPLSDEEIARLKKEFLNIVLEEFDPEVLKGVTKTAVQNIQNMTKASTLLNLSDEDTIFFLKSLHTLIGKVQEGAAKELKAQMDHLRRTLIGACMDRQSIGELRAFHVLLKSYHKEYKQNKGKLGVIDYDDMLFLALEVLKREEVREYIHATHSYVLVDESQDLSPLQHKIIENLSQGLPLFFVGDIKQSIYRFQGSDIKCMQDLENRAKNDEDNGERISLMDNFRSHRDILDPINIFFNKLWGEEKNGFIYEPLKAGREDDESSNIAVELFYLNSKDEFTSEDEPKLVAKQIAKLAREEGFSWGDIMLILPKMTTVSSFEDELKLHNIPFITVGQRGFYSRKEILTLTYLLSVIVNPYDDLAFCALLLSEYIGCKKSSLWHIRRGNESVYDRVRRIENIEYISSEERESIIRARELIEHIQNTPSLSLAQVIDILTTELCVKYAGHDGILARQNLIKIAEKAKAMSCTQNKDIYAFLAFLKSQQEAIKDDERFAGVSQADNDKVRITSIHRSKGLESKAVVFALTGDTANPDRNRFFVSSIGELAYKCFESSDDTVLSAMTTKGVGPYFNYQKIKDSESRMLEAERERLMYVAMTRAKEKLIISGFRKNKGESYINKIIDTLCDTKDGVITVDSLIYCCDNKLKIVSREEISALLAEGADTSQEGKSADKMEFNLAEYTDFLREIETPLELEMPKTFERIGVNKLLELNKCPRYYYLNEYMTNPLESEEREKRGAERSGNLALGNSFHDFIQHADFKQDLTGAQFNEYVKAAQVPSQVAENLKKRLISFSNAPIFAEIISAKGVYRELAFLYREGEMEIAGRIDMLLDFGDRLKVIDYKLGKISEKNEEQVQIYLQAVEGTTEGELLYIGEEGVESIKVTPNAKSMDYIKEMVAEATMCIREENFPAKKCELCEYCKKCELF